MIVSISQYKLCLKILHRLSLYVRRLGKFMPMAWIAKHKLNIHWTANELGERIGGCIGQLDEVIREATSEEKNAIIDMANKTLEHRFFILGSNGIILNPLVWHKDFKANFEWPSGKFYLDYKIVDPNNNADVKVPWELSRCHHLLWLGEAYLLTSDEEYAEEVIYEIEDWIDKNQFMHSINWTCTMDVAIRSINWMYAIYMIRDSEACTDCFCSKTIESLFLHGYYIFANLEKNFPYSHNHYCSDLSGLLFLGLLFKETKSGHRWLEFAMDELYQEIRAEVLPSGVHFERSISYHRLVTELFSYPYFALLRNQYSIPTDISIRLSSMYSYIRDYLPANGLAPTIEDNDDGRLLPFVPRDLRCHTYLVDPVSLEGRIMRNGCPMPFYEEAEARSKLYGDAGFAIMRNNDVFVCITNGGQSKYETSSVKVGSHTHNDLLSFVLSLGKDDIIVDPGTYVYTSDYVQRNIFRSTKKHNTIVVDGEEQNILPKQDMFVIEKNSRIGNLTLSGDNNSVNVYGDYSTLRERMHHARYFKLSCQDLSIKDIINKEGINHNLKFYIHLSNEIYIINIGRKSLIESNNYFVEILFDSSLETKISLEDDFIAPTYGVLLPSKTLIFEEKFNNMIEISTKIKWRKK